MNSHIKHVLVTGSSGLVGSAAVHHYCKQGIRVTGVDNDRRAYFFGHKASTNTIARDLKFTYGTLFNHVYKDIRDLDAMKDLLRKRCDLIIHAAAQPAHEWSVNNTTEDFAINATGTVNMLEAFRRCQPEAIFIHVSTSKVYGDVVNQLPLITTTTRFQLNQEELSEEQQTWVSPWGITESAPIQNSIHSPFGASKTCGDLMAQEYARYFTLRIAIFRPVCITGPAHQGVKLHGFLSYLARCIKLNHPYHVNGYNGLQVRGNIHASDLVNAFAQVANLGPFSNGEVYNIDGSHCSAFSIIEAAQHLSRITGNTPNLTFSDQPRRGDHRWCIFDSDKFKSHYPDWKLAYFGQDILSELAAHA